MTPKTRTSRSRFIAGATKVSSLRGVVLIEPVVAQPSPTALPTAVVAESLSGKWSGRSGDRREGKSRLPTPIDLANSGAALDIVLDFSSGAWCHPGHEGLPDSVHAVLPTYHSTWSPSRGWTPTPLLVFRSEERRVGKEG